MKSLYLETNSRQFLDLTWQEMKLFKIIAINRKNSHRKKSIYTLTIARQSTLPFQYYHKHLTELFQPVEPNQKFIFQIFQTYDYLLKAVFFI